MRQAQWCFWSFMERITHYLVERSMDAQAYCDRKRNHYGMLLEHPHLLALLAEGNDDAAIVFDFAEGRYKFEGKWYNSIEAAVAAGMFKPAFTRKTF